MFSRLLLAVTMFLSLVGFAGVVLTGCDDDPGVAEDMSTTDAALPDLRGTGG